MTDRLQRPGKGPPADIPVDPPFDGPYPLHRSHDDPTMPFRVSSAKMAEMLSVQDEGRDSAAPEGLTRFRDLAWRACDALRRLVSREPADAKERELAQQAVAAFRNLGWYDGGFGMVAFSDAARDLSDILQNAPFAGGNARRTLTAAMRSRSTQGLYRAILDACEEGVFQGLLLFSASLMDSFCERFAQARGTMEADITAGLTPELEDARRDAVMSLALDRIKEDVRFVIPEFRKNFLTPAAVLAEADALLRQLVERLVEPRGWLGARIRGRWDELFDEGRSLRHDMDEFLGSMEREFFLLSASRAPLAVEQELLKMRRPPVQSVQSCVEHVRRLNLCRAATHGIELRAKKVPAIALPQGQLVALFRALNTLAVMAIKSVDLTKEERAVTIEARQSGRFLILSTRDNGIGIADRDAALRGEDPLAWRAQALASVQHTAHREGWEFQVASMAGHETLATMVIDVGDEDPNVLEGEAVGSSDPFDIDLSVNPASTLVNSAMLMVCLPRMFA